MDGRFCIFFSLFVEDRNKYGIFVKIKKTNNLLFYQSVFYFVDGKSWHLGKMVDLDIMVTRNFFFGINEGIQLAKHNSVINARLERPKLKNTTYASPHVQNEIINLGKNIMKSI